MLKSFSFSRGFRAWTFPCRLWHCLSNWHDAGLAIAVVTALISAAWGFWGSFHGLDAAHISQPSKHSLLLAGHLLQNYRVGFILLLLVLLLFEVGVGFIHHGLSSAHSSPAVPRAQRKEARRGPAILDEAVPVQQASSCMPAALKSAVRCAFHCWNCCVPAIKHHTVI